ncbi:hypothetical protein M758_UG323500 [Ceratodon purpureus]|nr:hypothetical protein M758_UG323500 [Ceratodon purpureus]
MCFTLTMFKLIWLSKFQLYRHNPGSGDKWIVLRRNASFAVATARLPSSCLICCVGPRSETRAALNRQRELCNLILVSDHMTLFVCGARPGLYLSTSSCRW